MTRETKQDLELLRGFIREYDVSSLEKAPEFAKGLASQHARYLAFLTLLVEFSDQQSVLKEQGNDCAHLPTGQQRLFFNECASDLGQALFCWIHGAYKANRIMLRSAIETFVKAMCVSEVPGVITEKSVYKVFEMARQVTFFRTGTGASLLQELEAKYSELCEDVHSANPIAAKQISALKYFPAFVPIEAKRNADLLSYVISRQIIGLALHFSRAFHEMHHRNKESVLDVIPAHYRSRVQNID
jgi:hypothetical protein